MSVSYAVLGTRAKVIVAAFEQGRKDSRERNQGPRARYRDPERDAAYQRGFWFERQRTTTRRGR